MAGPWERLRPCLGALDGPGGPALRRPLGAQLPVLPHCTSPTPEWGRGQHLTRLPHGQQQPWTCPIGASASSILAVCPKPFVVIHHSLWMGQSPPWL